MVDENRGANSPAARLHRNRTACHTGLVDSSCVWLFLSLCRGGFQVPPGCSSPLYKVCSICTEFTQVLGRLQVILGLLTVLNMQIRSQGHSTPSSLGRKDKDESLCVCYLFIVLSLGSLCMCVTWAKCLSGQLHSRMAGERGPDSLVSGGESRGCRRRHVWPHWSHTGAAWEC